MHFTERDSVIVNFAARHKFVTAEQVAEYMGMSLKAAYRRLKKLVDNKFMYHERYFLQRPGVYYPSKKGTNAAGSDIAPIKEIPLGIYNHELKLVNLALEFYNQGYHVTTEREMKSALKWEIGQTGRLEHLPDLIVEKDGKKIAIELELSLKNPKRLKKIINYYKRQRHYDEVWYYVEKENIKKKLEQNIAGSDHIKVYMWGDTNDKTG